MSQKDFSGLVTQFLRYRKPFQRAGFLLEPRLGCSKGARKKQFHSSFGARRHFLRRATKPLFYRFTRRLATRSSQLILANEALPAVSAAFSRILLLSKNSLFPDWPEKLGIG
jgi:hypothetical protein